MKQRNRLPAIMLAVSLVVPVSADIIYSSVQLTIPTDSDGISVTIAGGVLNPSFGGVVVANDDPIQPFRIGTDGLDNILSFGDGVFINGSSGSLATGAGGSFEHVGSTFTAGAERYLGFKLSESNYGWARVVFTNNDTGAIFKDWAYDNTGAAIKTGWIKTDIVSGTAQTVTLNTATGESFTLGSSLANASGSITNSLVKTGAGTTILGQANTYTGATTVSAGILQIASAGSINTSGGVTVAAGAKFVYNNSSTALSIGLTLDGNGSSNRAVLGGTGAINTSVTLDNLGDTLSPGNSPGIQNYTPSQTWSSFSYDWEVNNFTGTTPGTHFDQIVIGGSLTLSGGSGSYVLNVLGLNAENVAGNVPNFSEINRSWTILTSTGTTGFDAANWTINTAGLSNADAGAWSLGQVGNNIVLSYAAIPEPSTALLGGLCLLFVLRRKRNA